MDNKPNGIAKLLELFEDTLSPSEVISSKLMAQISSAISKERLRLHMNQSDFAKYIGVTQSEISRWEHGNYNFSIKKISEIAAMLNLDVNIEINNSASAESSKGKIYQAPLSFSKTYIFYNRDTLTLLNDVSYSKSITKTSNYDYNEEDSKYVAIC